MQVSSPAGATVTFTQPAQLHPEQRCGVRLQLWTNDMVKMVGTASNRIEM